MLAIYSDGGPDHRCTYVSVQYSIIYLFLKLNLDMVVLARTPPGSSWKNPAERVMSQLNLALQSVGLMRSTASTPEQEAIISKYAYFLVYHSLFDHTWYSTTYQLSSFTQTLSVAYIRLLSPACNTQYNIFRIAIFNP